MNRRDALLGITLMASTLRSAWAQSIAPPVVLGQVSLSFYAVTGEVIAAVLERLGHRVEQVHGVHEDMFPLLAQARIDLMAAAWLPEGHASYWGRYGADAIEVATLYEGARFQWSVPDYVPADAVTQIGDLARPEVAARMTRQIQGIGDGATISVLSRQALQSYHLDAAGYSFHSGTQAQWVAALREAVSAQRWMVMPMWTPSFLIQGRRLRPLRDPLGVLGAGNRAALVGPRSRVDALPARTRLALSRIRLDLESVAEMDWQVNELGATPRDAARHWMAAHADRVDAWFSGVHFGVAST